MYIIKQQVVGHQQLLFSLLPLSIWDLPYFENPLVWPCSLLEPSSAFPIALQVGLLQWGCCPQSRHFLITLPPPSPRRLLSPLQSAWGCPVGPLVPRPVTLFSVPSDHLRSGVCPSARPCAARGPSSGAGLGPSDPHSLCTHPGPRIPHSQNVFRSFSSDPCF